MVSSNQKVHFNTHEYRRVCVCVGVVAYVCLCFTGLQDHTEQQDDNTRTNGDEVINEIDDVGDPFQPDASRWVYPQGFSPTPPRDHWIGPELCGSSPESGL